MKHTGDVRHSHESNISFSSIGILFFSTKGVIIVGFTCMGISSIWSNLLQADDQCQLKEQGTRHEDIVHCIFALALLSWFLVSAGSYLSLCPPRISTKFHSVSLAPSTVMCTRSALDLCPFSHPGQQSSWMKWWVSAVLSSHKNFRTESSPVLLEILALFWK